MKFIRATNGSSVLLGWKRIIYKPFLNGGSILKRDLRVAVSKLALESNMFSCEHVIGKNFGRPFSYTIGFWPRETYLSIGCCGFDAKTTKKIFEWLDIPFQEKRKHDRTKETTN